MTPRAVVGIWLSFAVCAAPAAAQSDADVAALMALVAGEYSNKPQVEAARGGAKSGEALPAPLREVHHMFATVVDMPRVGRHVAYIEWRHDDAKGAISGQRVWAFDAEAKSIRMHFHTLKPTAKAVLSGVTAADAKTRALGPDDLRPYPDVCHIMLARDGAGFTGTNQPLGGCAFDRSGVPGTMKVDAYLRFFPELHGEKTEILMLAPNQTPSGRAPEIEDWIYSRIR